MNKIIEQHKNNLPGGRIIYLTAKSIDELGNKLNESGFLDSNVNFPEGSAIYIPKKHKYINKYQK